MQRGLLNREVKVGIPIGFGLEREMPPLERILVDTVTRSSGWGRRRPVVVADGGDDDDGAVAQCGADKFLSMAMRKSLPLTMSDPARTIGFAPDFCHDGDPQSKGVVENLCGYSQSDLAVPLLTEAAIAGKAVSLKEANTAVHSEICAVWDQYAAKSTPCRVSGTAQPATRCPPD